MNAKEAIKEGTFNLVCIKDRIMPDTTPVSIVISIDNITARTIFIFLSEKPIISFNTRTLLTEHIAPTDKSIDPSKSTKVMPAAIIISGAESLRRLTIFAVFKKFG